MTSYREDYREAARHYWWTLPRAFGAGLVLVLIVYLFLVIVTPLTIGFGWARGEANLRSFAHVRDTYREAFDDSTAMDANARQSCRLDGLIAATDDPSVKSQRQSQELAIANNYDRIKGEYDAYMRDHFRGGVIRPSALPLPYPTLNARKATVC